MATTDTQTTDDVPDEKEVQENVEKGEDKDPKYRSGEGRLAVIG